MVHIKKHTLNVLREGHIDMENKAKSIDTTDAVQEFLTRPGPSACMPNGGVRFPQ